MLRGDMARPINSNWYLEETWPGPLNYKLFLEEAWPDPLTLHGWSNVSKKILLAR